VVSYSKLCWRIDWPVCLHVSLLSLLNYSLRTAEDLAELASHSGEKNRVKPAPPVASSRSTMFSAGALSVKLGGANASQKAALAELMSQKGRAEVKSRDDDDDAQIGFSQLGSGSDDAPPAVAPEKEGSFPAFSTKTALELR
jgi:hypothetical protein